MKIDLFSTLDDNSSVTLLDVLEETITILSKSKFSGRFALKGGLSLISSLGTAKHFERLTTDADLYWKDEESWKELVGTVDNLLTTNSRLGLVYEVTKSREFRDGSFVVKLQASKGDLHYKFSIDMNIGDLSLDLFESRELLGGNTVIKMYSLEAMLADKLKVLSGKVLYRRSKDLYDIFVLSHLKDFRMYDLLTTFKIKHGLENYVGVYFLGEGDIEVVKKGYDSLVLPNKPEFQILMNRVLSFTLPIYESSRIQSGNHKWDALKGEWFQC